MTHEEASKILATMPLAGVRYSVIRRPFSSGKGNIKQKESKQLKSGFRDGESTEEFYARLQQYFKDEPHEWFARWNVPVASSDLESFKHRCLNPVLEQLCDWYQWMASDKTRQDPFGCPFHWMQPFGLYSPLIDGSGTTDLDEYLLDGSTTGLHKVNTLFSELTTNE